MSDLHPRHIPEQLAELSPAQQELLRRRIRQLRPRREEPAPPASFHALFEEQAARCPDRVAVACCDEQLTYAALDRLTNRLAHLLRARGVGRGSLVGLCAPRSVWAVAGLLAVLKAGGAYVPLDPGYPGERLAYMVEDASLPLVLTQRSVLEVLPDSGARLLTLEDLWPRLDEWPGTPLETVGTVDDLAYVIYTSGSTGRPKGVQVTHRGFAPIARWQHENYGLATPQRVLQGTSLSFDISVWELSAALLSGGTLVLPDPELPMMGSALAELLVEQGVQNIALTPSALATLPHDLLPDVDCVSVGGESCPLDLVRVWAADRALFNGYGPTEATVGVTLARYEPDLERVHIGRPIDGARTYVLDARMRPQPVGVAGELYLGGAGLARGYLGRPDLTAEAFVADPFDGSGARLYRTGDLARLLDDGNIEFLGRVDEQVKIRGFRVEPGEIEAALAHHPSVRSAAVLLDEDGAAKRLVAFVVSHEPVAGETLRAFLAERLPAHMVPAVYVPLESMPLTVNRKVDRRALAALPWREWSSGDGLAGGAPGTVVEERLAGIWQAVLGLDRPVGVHDNFFALGGDSILSLQVVFRARQQGLHVSVKQLFEFQSVGELAGVVGLAEAPVVVAEQGVVTGRVELTPIQRWFFAQDFVRPEHVNQSLLLEVAGGLDEGQWRGVVRRLLVRHDGLRAGFRRGERGWRAELAGVPDEVPWQVHDLAGVPSGERWARLLEIAGQVQGDFDLGRPPLLRAVLFTGLDATGPRLLLVAHHLVIDVVSWHVLLDDLGALLTQARAGRELTLPPKSSSWAAWAGRLRREASSETTAAEAAYWREQAAADAAVLPQDGPGGANTVGASRTYEAELDEEGTRALLRDVPAAFRTQINDVLLTGVAGALGAWAGHDHVRLDIEGHGREELFEDLDISRTVGWFTSLSPLRLPTPCPSAPGAGLKQIKELLRGRPRHGVGHGLLALGGEAAAAELSGAARAQVSFNYLGRFDTAAGRGSSGPLRGDVGTSMGVAGPDWHPDNRRPYLLDIVSMVHDGRLRMSWAYDPQTHTEDTVAQLAQNALDILRRLADEARRPEVRGYTPGDLPLSGLCQEQIDGLLDSLTAQPAWQEAGVPRPLEDCYPQTGTQQGLWFQSSLARGEGLYHVQQLLGFEHGLDVAAFVESWAWVMRRHPILRTSFTHAYDEALQLVWSEVPVPLTQQDWRDADASEQQARLDTYLSEERGRGFGPGDVPQWRMLLARTAEDGYQLVWSAHHSILDGWSISLVLREVSQRYTALVQGTAAEPEPAAPPFRDYVAWLLAQDAGAAEEYWRRTLEGYEEPAPLELGRPAGAEGAAEQAWTGADLDEADTAALREFAATHGLTVNTVLQGCWALLLSRYTRTEDVVFGTVTSGRAGEVEGVEQMAGLFINTLPLRVGVHDDVPALQWLKDLQEQNVAMRQYEHVPLSQVQRWSEIPAGTALFETLFVFENYPEDPDGAGALRYTETGSKEQTHYPLNVVVTVGERIGLNVLYDTRRCDSRTAEAAAGHLRQVCRTLLAHPHTPLARVNVLTERERAVLLREWPGEEPEDGGGHWHTHVREQALRTPDAVAVSHEDHQLSYAELDRRANQLAHWLRKRGVGPDVLVGLCLERSVESVIAILGILKAGGAYVPVDPRYPRDRVAYVAKDAGLELILTQEHLLPGLPDDGLRPLCLDTGWPEVAAEPDDTPPETTLTPDNLAYLIYTSGSTGRPKGVMVAHRCIGHLLPWIRRHPWFARPQNVLQVASTSFDFSVWEIVMPLVTGGTVHIPAPHLRMIGTDLHRVLDERAIESLNFTPGALATLPTEPPLPHLRTLVVGGEAYSADLIRTWAPGRTFYNVYGPTETTVFATGTHTDEHLDTIHIGRPLTNVRTYVLDTRMEPVPVGVPGELYIGGAGVTRGYMNRPDLTAERYVADPFGDEPGGRLYKSGDLVRYLPDGNIEFVDRVDSQVKIRGFRIELGEIESVLEQHPRVRSCAVLAQPGDAGKRLVGYVVPEHPGDRDAELPEHLSTHLRGQLPSYMVPAAFVLLDELPLNGNGKLNRRALPLPEENTPAARALPRTTTEALTAEIWQEVLGRHDIGVHDDFFALGGHSLLAVKVQARVRQTFGVELPVSVLFEQPTVAQTAAQTDLLTGREQTHPALPLVPVPRDRPLPATFEQQRLWYMDRLHPDSPLYTVGWLLHQPRAVDAERLRNALAVLAERHETLRTTLRESGGGIWQDIAETAQIVLEEADLSAEPPERHAEAVRTRAHQLWNEPFDLTAGPLLRTLLVHLPDSRSMLVFSAHHVIIDGFSVPVFNDELLAAYDALTTGGPLDRTPLAVQYADYAVWQRQWLDEERLRPHLEYWREQLAEAPALISLPADHPRPAVQTFAGASHTVTLPAALGERVGQVGEEHRTTRFVVLLSAFALLLHRYSGQDQVVIGVPVANRGRVETEPLIGFLVNTLALCVDFTEDPDFSATVRQVRWKLLEAQNHQQVPFDRIVEELRPERSLSHSPVFQVMFTGLDHVLADGQREEEQAGWARDVLEEGIGVAKFDLGLSVQEHDGALRLTFEYSTGLFEPKTVAAMGEHLRLLAEAALETPDTPVARLPLLSEHERHDILVERNRTEDERLLRPVCLHRLVEEQARRTPDRIALSSAEGQLSYAALDRGADLLARRLRASGVGPETRVGVAAHRSPGLVTALLAVLKAGGAYVPLDPDLPRDRLAFIAEDARIPVALTEASTRDAVGFLGEHGVELIDLDSPDTYRLQDGEEPARADVHPDNLAYVIYTSGSTGRPKGAMLAHRGIVNRLLWMQETYGLRAEDRVLQKTPFGFDVSVWEFFWPLLAGARLHLVRPGGHRDAGHLVELIDEQAVGTVHFVPSMLRAFLQQRTVTERCASVRNVVCSGEALPVEVQEECLELLPGARLHNLYGPTETSVDVSFWECASTPGASGVPLGSPVANTRLHVLDASMSPVPDGVVGELYVGGVQLARGYLARPDLTAERFVADPFGPGRLYATGDLARYRADGVIEYVGRRDHQVKLRGYRIEIGEIESVLADHPAVLQCLVVVHETSGGDKRLVAFVATGDAPGAPDEELAAHLLSRLPEYMVPAHFVALPAFPLTTNGKIDRRALPPLRDVVSKARGSQEYVAPRTGTETALAELWAELLGLEQVGVRDDFFALGGHSLLVASLATEVQSRWGVELKLPVVFQNRTVEALALVVDRGVEEGDAEEMDAAELFDLL